MAFWKQKYNRTDGFSLIEVIVAITILGFIAVPMLSGLLKSYQLNLRSDERMQAQLAVSSAVETIMAEGFNEDWYIKDFNNIPEGIDPTEDVFYHNRFSDVKITASKYGAAFKLNVASKTETDIFVDTYARPYGGA